nr:hypothetical protein [Tanacetum cinerariifolium]
METGYKKAREDTNDFIVDEEHIIDEPEVDMTDFRLHESIEGGLGTQEIHIEPQVVINEEDLDVIDFDSFKSETNDDIDTTRRKEIRKVRKQMKANASGVPTLENCNGEFGTWKGHVDISMAKKGGPALGNCIKGKNTTLDGLKEKNKDKHVGKDQGSIDKGKKVTVEKMEDEKSRNIKACTANFLAEHLMETINANPEIPVKAVQEQMQKKFSLGISRMKAFRAKSQARSKDKRGLSVAVFIIKRLCLRVKKCNPDTTVKIELGFKACLRDILGLDGAFMKGPFPGKVLTAVSVDGNNGIYPLAYAIVEAETTNSWTWFLECLGSDLELGMMSNFTFVTDRQKLLDARDAPIISALEYIREYLMKRIVIVQKIQMKCNGPLTPTVTKLFEVIKTAANQYTATWNGGDQYEVKGHWMDQCVMDMGQRICFCRKWELTGLPCKHDVASLWNMAQNGMEVGFPEDWVHPAYQLKTWIDAYSFKINPVNGRDIWGKYECPTTLVPPLHHTQVGRPKKNRKRSAYEISQIVTGGKLSRKGKSVTCSKCKNKGHNKRACKGQGGSQQGAPGLQTDGASGSRPIVKRTKKSANPIK